MQGYLLADIADNLGKREQHVFGVGSLHLFIVETDQNLQVLRIDIRLDPRPHGSEGIRALGPPESRVIFLPGPLADVVAAGIAQDVFLGISGLTRRQVLPITATASPS